MTLYNLFRLIIIEFGSRVTRAEKRREIPSLDRKFVNWDAERIYDNENDCERIFFTLERGTDAIWLENIAQITSTSNGKKNQPVFE